MTQISAHRRLFAEKMPRMKKYSAATLFLLTVIFGTLSGISFPSPIFILYSAYAASLFAAILFMRRTKYVYLSPILTFIVTAAVSGHLPTALLATMYTPIAVAIAVTFYEKSSKAASVMASSVALTASLALIALFTFIVNKDVFPSVKSVTDSIVESLRSATVNTPDGRVPLFTEQAASGLAEYIVLSLPAVFIIVINSVSYLAASLFALQCRLFYFADRIPGGKWVYSPEVIPAVIFILSYFVSALLVPFASADVLGYAAENVLIALTPAMMIAGERCSYAVCQKHDKKVSLVVISLILLLISPSLYLMIISFWGALHVIIKSVRPKLRKLFRTDDDDEPRF